MWLHFAKSPSMKPAGFPRPRRARLLRERRSGRKPDLARASGIPDTGRLSGTNLVSISASAERCHGHTFFNPDETVDSLVLVWLIIDMRACGSSASARDTRPRNVVWERIVITKTAILEALDELTNYGEGFRFQALGVILAKNKCRELKASEPKSDLGLDAYAPGELFENGLGRGVACSNTATLTKIREDIEEAQKHFTDLKVLFFATPRPVSEKKAKGWREKVKKDYGIALIVISREEVISELLKPENASLCSSILRIPTTIEVSLEQIASDCRAATAEINAWWVPRIPGAR